MNDGASSRYRVEKKLGQGGVGEVFLAHDLALNRKVALKFLAADQDDSAHKRFLREAKSAASIDHPYICKIYEMGELNGRTFIALEYVEGSTLRACLDEGPLKTAEALRLTSELLEAMMVAHDKGIVHRDLKPANIMLTHEGHAKVVDFGLAKQAEDTAGEATTISEVTERGAVIGTLTYMSPEQLRAEYVNTASDVFACGIIVYEMFAGVHPFSRTTREATTAAILHEDALPIKRQGVDRRLGDIVLKMLARDRRHRYASCAEPLVDLQNMLQDRAWQPGAMPETPSIAVLPFADLSPEHNQEYFCDGLAEELINSLMGIQGLRVAARTSSFYFKNKDVDLEEIGQQLGTRTVLEGGVRKSGERLRVTAQLIDLADGQHLWSQKFERKLDDVLRVQDEIASAIVETLRVTLLDDDEQRAFGAHPRVASAHDMYLRGRHEWNTRTSDGLLRSVDYFKLAASDDPTYAQAQAGQAEAYVLLAAYGARAPQEVMPKARAAAEKAIAIRDTTGEAHNALACVLSAYDWNWKQAEKSFRRALEVSWRYPTAHQWYAMQFLCPRSRWREAQAELQVALDLDPLSPIIRASAGVLSYYRGEYEQSYRELQAVAEEAPELGLTHLFLGLVNAERLRHEEAIEGFQRAIPLMGDNLEAIAGLGYAYALAGNKQAAKEQVNELRQLATERYVSPVLHAQIEAGLGEPEAAFDSLKRAHECHATELIWLGVRPVFRRLHTDPRWPTLLEAIGFRV